VWLGAVAATLILVFGAGLWRLMQGPINLDVLIPSIEAAINRSAGGPRITISGGRLGFDRQTRQLDLRIQGIRISQSDGEPVASFPEMSASFSLRSLLHGRVAPARVMVQRPVLRLIRDEAGSNRVRFGDEEQSFGSEILEQLTGSPQPGAPFGLLRRVIVRDATLVLDDRQAGRRWKADRVDATIERNPEGFTGDLSLSLPIAARRPEFHASYRYSSAEHMLDLALEIGAVEPAALASIAPELAPLAVANFPVSGTLETRLNIAQFTNEGLRADLRFGKGSIRSELLPEGFLALQEGTLRAVYAPETGELRLAKLDLDLGGGSAVTVTGVLDGVTPAILAGGDPPQAIPGRLGIVLADVPVAKFESLWPPSLSRGGRSWVLANVHDGVLDEAAVQLDLEVHPAARSAEVVSAHGTMRYHDATITYFHGLAPARKVSGTAKLEDKVLMFTPTGGTVKSVQVTGGSLVITDLGAPVEWLTLDLAFNGPIQDVLETIDAKPLRYSHEIGVDPARVSGRTEAHVHFKLPLLQDFKLDQVEYGVKAGFTGAGIANAAMNRNLTDGNFALDITRPGAHLQGTARFDGVPLGIDANLFFKPKEGARARYRVAMALNDEQRQRLGFDFLPERLMGPVGIDLTYRAIDARHAEAEATLDLRSAGMSVVEAGWKKPPGAPANATMSLDLYDERVVRLPEIAVKAAGLDGKFAVALAPLTGQIDRVDVRRLVIGNDDVTGFVTRRREGGWYVGLRGPALDISHWIKDLTKGGTSRNSAPALPLQIDANVGRLLLGPRREVHDFTAQLLRESGDWQAAQIEARFVNGRQLSLHSGKEDGWPSLTFRSDDLGSTLSLFDITDNIVGGRVVITSQVSNAAGKRGIVGHIEGSDYSLVRAPVLARILSLPSFSGVSSMLSGSGIPFGTLRGDFTYNDNHLVLEHLLAYGGAIGATANGTVDFGRDRLDLRGTIVPAYALNSIIGNIPLIGSLLLGGEGEGLFAANYRLTGSSADPQASVDPLSALAPGFLRRLFQPNFGLPPPVQQSLGVR
jgi:uncharacterized protein YhdP